jgi:hypothetical protein
MPARVRLYFPLKTCLLLSLILGLAQNPCDLAGDSGKETFTVFLMVFVFAAIFACETPLFWQTLSGNLGTRTSSTACKRIPWHDCCKRG